VLPILLGIDTAGVGFTDHEGLAAASEASAQRCAELFVAEGVTTFEIGQEWDTPTLITPGTGGNGNDPKQYNRTVYGHYLALLRGMSRGVRKAAAAASSSNVSYSNIGVNNGGWLHYGWYTMLEQDQLDYDFIGYHWYSEMGDLDHAGALENNRTDPMYDVFANLLKLNKPIWITELDRRGGSSAAPIHGVPLSQPEYLDREVTPGSGI
jgi:hypothetical protein